MTGTKKESRATQSHDSLNKFDKISIAQAAGKCLVPAAITIAVTAWAVDAAEAWRGYSAVGGEWLIPVIGWVAWMARRKAKNE
jgi:hypothetical protein